MKALGVSIDLEDHGHAGSPLPPDFRFLGDLHGVHREAIEALGAHYFGVLAATTAFGKTVFAAALIALRQRNTLVLVHRRELMD